jgi:Sigma-70 region 2
MKDAASLERMALEQDERISEVLQREQSRLRHIIRRRVPDAREAEDILRDVFYALVEANRLLMPIEHVTAGRFAWRAIASSTSFARGMRGVSAMRPLRTKTTNCGWKT